MGATMPNAQTHLASVWDLLNRPPIQAVFGWLAEPEAQAAFLLGAISPDVRIVSGHSREETHFFGIPALDPRSAPVIFLDTWPELANAALVSRQQAAFISGYMTHLVMDQVWVERIVMDGLFIEGLEWGIGHPNWRLYSILMTYLEYRAASRLPRVALERLSAARPDHWLPFVEDKHLAAWRSHVLSHVGPGGARHISRLFARTNGLTSDEMESIVLSDEQMAAEVYGVISPAQIVIFDAETTSHSVEVVSGYLSGLALDG